MTLARRTLVLCLAVAAVGVGALVVGVLREPRHSDDALRELGVFVLPKPRDVAPFALVDHTGAPFGLERLRGKWTFAFFGFTHCPDVCPTTMSELGRVDRGLQETGGELAQGFQGVLVTVDPERDTAVELGGYATAFSDRFLGVRGEGSELSAFAKQVDVAYAKAPLPNGRYSVEHTGNLVIFDPRGRYHGFIKLPHKAETIRLAYQTLAARF